MKILISGATGLVGKQLVRHLKSRGHEVNFLTTRREEINAFGSGVAGFLWNPRVKVVDVDSLEDVEVIIHLAGASISEPWTPKYKQTIVESRVASAELLFEAVKKHGPKVRHFISASGIGIYKDSVSIRHDEASIAFQPGFLGDVVKKWEAVADKFSLLNIAVTKVRTGLVLSADGGALPELAKPIRWGAGAPLGSGDQMQSWIHIDDLAGIYAFIAEHQLPGVYNAVAPNPTTNRAMTKAVAKRLKRPVLLPAVPAFMLRLILGERYKLLVESQYVSADKIVAAGYNFRYPHLRDALLVIYP